MVNMNHHKDPAIYGLTDPDGGVFYIGRTTVNALNRFWQHKSRARDHSAPVYVRMREHGIENVSWTMIERFADIPDGVTPKQREAWWIARYIGDGADIVNALGRDGTPDKWSPEMRERGVPSRRGRPTWIKGKTGEDAGWTQDRRKAQSQRLRMRAWEKEILNPELLHARVLRMEQKEIRRVQRECAEGFLTQSTSAPRAARPSLRHGTRTMWEKYKCKCQPCRDAGARRNARKRGNPDWESVTAGPIVEAEYKTHGTWNCYKHGGCRCESCREAARRHRLRAK